MTNIQDKKKAKYIPVVWNGNIEYKEDVSMLDFGVAAKEFFKNSGFKSVVKLGSSRSNVWSGDGFIFIFKRITREHMKSSTGGEINHKEKFRTRYSATEVDKLKEYYRRGSNESLVVSYYYAGDKVLFFVSHYTPIIFRKVKITSDSRVVSLDISYIKQAYECNEPLTQDLNRRACNVNKIIALNNEKTVMNAFFTNLKSYSLNLDTPILKSDVISDLDKEWKLSSLNRIKDFLEKKDLDGFIGELGEFASYIKLCYEYEKENVTWHSKLNKFAPFDFHVNEQKFWEVKSTRSSSNEFHLSDGEAEFMLKVHENWTLLRLDLKPFLDKNGEEVFRDIETSEMLSNLVERELESRMIAIESISASKVMSFQFKNKGFRVRMETK